MTQVDAAVWLACGYAMFLLLAAYGLDLMARRASRHTNGWDSGSFVYHQDHDAWMCPQDQWLWPQSFDPDNRVMRYRANPTVCNSCPVKATCTTSHAGREVSRNVDPWPHSEAGRFHRGMACTLSVLAVLLPLLTAIGRSTLEVALLGGIAALLVLGSLPLWSHLRGAPSGFPDHVPVRPLEGRETTTTGPTSGEDRDRFSTRWGGFQEKEPENDTAKDPEAARPPGWSRINPS